MYVNIRKFTLSDIVSGLRFKSAIYFCLSQEDQEDFEDIKGVIKVRKSKKNKQHNHQNKKGKTTIYTTLHRKPWALWMSRQFLLN